MVAVQWRHSKPTCAPTTPTHTASPTPSPRPGSAWIPPARLGFEDLDDLAPDGSGTAQLMLHRVETFPAGTRFGTWLRLDRASDLEATFFTDVLAAFVADGRLDGRAGIGHGQVDKSTQT